jgi:hypothetical protein
MRATRFVLLLAFVVVQFSDASLPEGAVAPAQEDESMVSVSQGQYSKTSNPDSKFQLLQESFDSEWVTAIEIKSNDPNFMYDGAAWIASPPYSSTFAGQTNSVTDAFSQVTDAIQVTINGITEEFELSEPKSLATLVVSAGNGVYTKSKGWNSNFYSYPQFGITADPSEKYICKNEREKGDTFGFNVKSRFGHMAKARIGVWLDEACTNDPGSSLGIGLSLGVWGTNGKGWHGKHGDQAAGIVRCCNGNDQFYQATVQIRQSQSLSNIVPTPAPTPAPTSVWLYGRPCWPIKVPTGKTRFSDCTSTAEDMCAGSVQLSATLDDGGAYYSVNHTTGCVKCPEYTSPSEFYQDAKYARALHKAKNHAWAFEGANMNGRLRDTVLCSTHGNARSGDGGDGTGHTYHPWASKKRHVTGFPDRAEYAVGGGLYTASPAIHEAPQEGGVHKGAVGSTTWAPLIPGTGDNDTPAQFQITCWLYKVVGCYSDTACATAKRIIFWSIKLDYGSYGGMQKRIGLNNPGPAYTVERVAPPGVDVQPLPAAAEYIRKMHQNKNLCMNPSTMQ